MSDAKDLIVTCKPKLLSMRKTLGVKNELYVSISSAVVGHAQSMLVSAVNASQKNIEKDIYHRFLGIATLKIIVEEALVVSFMLFKLDMNFDLQNHCKNNLKALKALAAQLDISTLSPEEKLDSQIRKLQGQISRAQNATLLESELRAASQKMDRIKQWQLFRSPETRDKQIAEQIQSISNIKQKAESQKQAIIRELGAQITKLEQELEKLK